MTYEYKTTEDAVRSQRALVHPPGQGWELVSSMPITWLGNLLNVWRRPESMAELDKQESKRLCTNKDELRALLDELVNKTLETPNSEENFGIRILLFKAQHAVEFMIGEINAKLNELGYVEIIG